MDAAQALLDWYRQNARALPWRESRDPFRIWVSESMLQQTTTTAAIPYFQRFIARFPELRTLAEAPLSAVLEAWSGLGYYSRARNLHKAAQALRSRGGFPQRFEELLELPGFGPYTARAVASIAFAQEVGVVDGNVIRVLSRVECQPWEWWKSRTRAEIQARADAWVRGRPSHEINQALMDLGRTVCTPKSPSCLLCPLRRCCLAHARDQVAELPKPRPRRTRELWLWQPRVQVKNGRVLLCRNKTAPFLRGQWLLPGETKRLRARPKAFDYRHSITHHDIFVSLANSTPTPVSGETKWVLLKDIRRHVPASLVHKALDRALSPTRSPRARRWRTCAPSAD